MSIDVLEQKEKPAEDITQYITQYITQNNI